MTLEIAFAPDEEAKLRGRAAALGQDLETFIREAALERANRPTLLELLAPVHEDTRRRGITVDQVDAAIDRARQGYLRERQTGRAATDGTAPNP